MYNRIKDKVYRFLDPDHIETKWERWANYLVIFLIIFNTIAIIIETVGHIYEAYKSFFIDLEFITVIVFSVELVLRVWSCTSNEKYRHPVKGRIKYLFHFETIIDIMSILPFYLPLIHADFIFLRILRLFRFLRFLKLNRYLHASRLIKNVVVAKKDELVFSAIITAFLIIIASSVMYYVEHEHQPHQFSSIPETMWWSVATLTTVGYGDIFPITPLGKTLASIISILGIGMFALPAGILASGFSAEFHKKKHKEYCPHCGKELHE